MSDTLFKIRQIVSLIVFIGALSLMGMVTKQPLMILAYAAFFMAVMAIMYFSMRKHQRHNEITQTNNSLMRKIVGFVLFALAVVAPLLIALRTNVINLPVDLSLGAAIGIVGGVTVLFIALILVAVYMINVKGNELSQRIIGYVAIIVAAAIPGLLMSRVDGTTTGIGSVYYVAMAVLILAFNGYGFLTVQD
ncbi:MAG: hypothetical protein RBS43_03980 [Candidatus Cloacimonas sp.]|nr:hypothetical protein [Candidatus Cloacimonas sp.]